MPDPSVLAGKFGALKSWANTVDRPARTAPARRDRPASVEYHLARQDPARFADATDEQRLAAAEAARRAWTARSKTARRRRRRSAR
jgi:hypothetical protein